ncbi:MAG: hypothetical protein WD873_04695 [Candidatus Hydrogenedentales bacterium]
MKARQITTALILMGHSAFSAELTLEQKAAVFEHDLHERFSLEGQILCKLMLPAGDRDFIAYNMPDNAYMTGMVLGALSAKYAVTGATEDRERAAASIRALHLLSNVSGKSGLLARAAWPVDRPMADDGTWRKSDDGKWLWRGDVSSDQVDGVFFGYALAYDLVANDEEQAWIARDTEAIVDHILENDLRIIDYDGEPTQWGSYYPEYVKSREPMNALLWLQHLKVAEHVNPGGKYGEIYRRFAVDEGYAEVAERARALRDPQRQGAINHSDDVLIFMALYPLLEFEKDADLRGHYLAALRRAWFGNDQFPGVQPEDNPLYAFIAKRFLGDEIDVAPSIANLKRFPLDMKWNRTTLAQYAAKFGTEMVEPITSPEPGPGDAIPLDRRQKSWSAWVMDPYHGTGTRNADSGLEYNGHDYLLAYWLGRYWGYIDAGN